MNLYWQIKPGIYTSATFVTTNYLIHSKFWKKYLIMTLNYRNLWETFLKSSIMKKNLHEIQKMNPRIYNKQPIFGFSYLQHVSFLFVLSIPRVLLIGIFQNQQKFHKQPMVSRIMQMLPFMPNFLLFTLNFEAKNNIPLCLTGFRAIAF